MHVSLSQCVVLVYLATSVYLSPCNFCVVGAGEGEVVGIRFVEFFYAVVARSRSGGCFFFCLVPLSQLPLKPPRRFSLFFLGWKREQKYRTAMIPIQYNAHGEHILSELWNRSTCLSRNTQPEDVRNVEALQRLGQPQQTDQHRSRSSFFTHWEFASSKAAAGRSRMCTGHALNLWSIFVLTKKW